MTDVKDIPLHQPHEGRGELEVKEGWPILRLAGHLEGVKRRDVYAYLKGLVARHFHEHTNERAFVSLKRWRNGWLYELCLGGDGESRVKSMAKFMDDNPPETRVKLPAGQRYGEMYLHPEGRVVYRLLPEGHHPSHEELKPHGKAQKLYPNYGGALVWGTATLLVGASVLALGVGLSAVGEMKLREDAIAQAEARDSMNKVAFFESLPVSHVPSEADLLDEPRAKEFVQALRYENGEWKPPQVGCVGSECPGDKEALK